MTTIRLLDAFAGIGGFHLGLQQACEELDIPFGCVGAIENNPNAIKTYQANFPTTKMFDDITKLDMSALPTHDILTGGFPCQPFSRARHNRTGSAGVNAIKTDDRTFKFKYLCEILQAKQPSYFIFENVTGLLSETLPDGTLFVDYIEQSIRKCGYGVKHIQLNTNMFGVPQKRERVFFIGRRNDLTKVTFDISFYKKGLYQPKYLKDILEKHVDKKYLLKNLWSKIPNHRLPGNRYDAILQAYNSTKWKKPAQCMYKVVTSARVEGDTPSGHSRQRDRVFNSMGISPTLTCSTPISISIDKSQILRQLTPKEYSKIQMFPDTFILAETDSINYKQFGNAVCVEVVKQIGKEFLKHVSCTVINQKQDSCHTTNQAAWAYNQP